MLGDRDHTFILGLSRCEESESLFEALALGALSIQRFCASFCIFLPSKIIGGTVVQLLPVGTREFLPGHFSSNVFTTEFRPRAKARGVETCGKTASRCDVTSSICHFLRLVRWTWVTIVNAPVTRGGARAVMAGAFDESKHVQPPVAAPLIFGWI